MFGIRRRWPVLTATGAALLYVVNNYQVTGLEQLQLKPLGSPQRTAASQAAPPFDDSQANPLSFDLTQFGINTSPPLADNFQIDPYLAHAPARSPAWNELLSVGEKLALWQDQLSQTGSSAAPSTPARPAFPNSSPIPIPPGFTAPTSGLPSTVGSRVPTATTTPIRLPAEVDVIPSGVMTSLDNNRSGAGPDIPTNFGGGPSNGLRTIRLASFKLPALGTALLNKPQVVQMLVTILRQYDVVALQGIQSNRDDILPLIVDQLNQSGRSFDYLIGPRVGRAAPHQQFAYIFDTSRLETDRYQLYSVDDPEDLMHYEPLVAWFRCKGVPPSAAFTFTLINIAIDPLFADAERALLPSLVEAVQRDGRHEDDWILLGDFAGGNAQLTMLEESGVRFAISDIPTDVAGTKMLSTLIFSGRATTEFTGRAGVFDFLRKHNLSIEQAMEVSEHMPVWAEFTYLEGAQPGRIAPIANP